ncbi:valine--tRNA ligase, mitochondrial [Antennarius striatus]|uniref:valine--tRNA ligase, mitochondrial n=1 Tax=Antennarius striatus TaxID=241820 RepID=UPI0035B03FAC
MWRAGRVARLSGRGAVRAFSSEPSEPPSPHQPHASPRTQAEKLRRRRRREAAILSGQSRAAKVQWSEKEKIVYTAHTPPGTKKDTNTAFPSSYSPEYVESSWYEWWEKEGVFRPETQEGLPHAVDQTFCLCIPPPNVTGSLHLGHALTVAVEDALVRWKRMQGLRVLWVPGCDHAGIATQTVVERKLLRERGKHRRSFSRQEFLQEVWSWKNEKGEEIYQQLRQLGASLDWSRACFTMDPGFSRAVTEAFVRLSDSGLIYRSEALVNWSCALESAISDIEVDLKELPGPTMLSVPGYERTVEFGTLFTFAYPTEDDGVEVCVSTTRPETMLGDVAVAVHPDDPRYQALHGKQCRHPFTHRLLPVITDPSIDMTLGTGAMKVTPAHDHTDFLLSQTHSLPRLTVIGGDGTMTPPCGQWLQGVKRFDARQLVVEALAEKKLFRGRRDHAMNLPVCSRSGDVIEPLIRKQWFVRCREMAQRAVQAVEDGELEIIPQIHTKTWKNWLSSISDWCISRQLWWGHQVPAYQVELPGNQEGQWVWGRTEDEARQRAALQYGVKPEAVALTRDPDVLDTWFSSALFPFAMLGWPDETPDLQRFYPNSILETGSDLIFFWAARMVMLGSALTGRLPFKQILLHPLVRDKHGRKMSKSLGNVIDPLDIIHGVPLEKLLEKVVEGNLDPREQLVALEAQRTDFPDGIPECGTDALRFALCSNSIQGDAISLSVSQVLTCRNFCNKMWQTLRFTLGALEDNPTPLTSLDQIRPVGVMDQWICSRLFSTVEHCERHLQAYELHSAASSLQAFWVHSLCDVYLECVKPVLAPAAADGGPSRQQACSVLFHCVGVSLALLAPFMPFITEELWQRLHAPSAAVTPQASLCLQPYPRSSQMAHCHFPEVERDFLLVKEVVRVARALRAQCGLTREKPAMWAVCSPPEAQTLLRFQSAVGTLGRVSSLQVFCPHGADGPAHLTAPPSRSPVGVVSHTPPPSGCLVGVVSHTCQLHLHVQNASDVDQQVERLTQRRNKLVPRLEEVLHTLRSPDFLSKAPARVQQQMENKVSALQQELKTIEEQLEALEVTPTTE